MLLSTTSKKYKVIVKIKNNTDGTAYCVKYRCDNLQKLLVFLDTKWSEWKWSNVYANTGKDKGKQLANFTKNNRPKSRYI